MTTFYVRIDKLKTVPRKAENATNAVNEVYNMFMHTEPDRSKYYPVERKKKVLQ